METIGAACNEIVVMTENSRQILTREYGINPDKIQVIPHGTHMVNWVNKAKAKAALGLENYLVMSTFGLLGPNKGIETAIDALPAVVEKFPDVLYLVLGRTHPCVVRDSGEAYRTMLEDKVDQLGLNDNVRFVNRFLELPELLDFLRVTDIYLFTSKDPHQAVSGTFAYALSTGCPVISTPIPHAVEILQGNTGVIVDFGNPSQLSKAALYLLNNESLREQMGRNALHQSHPSVWENNAQAVAKMFERHIWTGGSFTGQGIKYDLPKLNTSHLKNLTDDVGIIQFSDINEPDISSGYTLDDNARALIALSIHYSKTGEDADLRLLDTYLSFLERCQQPNGKFLNYVDQKGKFHVQNQYTNLEDSNGRAVWACGVVMANHSSLPFDMVRRASNMISKAYWWLPDTDSPRAIAYVIRGVYHIYSQRRDSGIVQLIDTLAKKLVDKFSSVAEINWQWFEEYLTYANSALSEAMLYAYRATRNSTYKMIAQLSFNFLLEHLFVGDKIKVVSNRGWHQKGIPPALYGEQPIDVFSTIQTLDVFYQFFRNETYLEKMEIAFSWFLGNNHLNQIMYNPLTGAGYDGLEEHNVNMNQGAESGICYLMARMIIGRYRELPATRPEETALRSIGAHRIPAVVMRRLPAKTVWYEQQESK